MIRLRASTHLLLNSSTTPSERNKKLTQRTKNLLGRSPENIWRLPLTRHSPKCLVLRYAVQYPLQSLKPAWFSKSPLELAKRERSRSCNFRGLVPIDANIFPELSTR